PGGNVNSLASGPTVRTRLGPNRVPPWPLSSSCRAFTTQFDGLVPLGCTQLIVGVRELSVGTPVARKSWSSTLAAVGEGAAANANPPVAAQAGSSGGSWAIAINNGAEAGVSPGI